jgi:hypothetical protein
MIVHDEETGKNKVDYYEFLWQSANIAALYGQPPYKEMKARYEATQFSTPREKQLEKALLDYFQFYEKETEIFKRDFLAPVLEARKMYAEGNPEGLKRLTEILNTSPFSRIKALSSAVQSATQPAVAKNQYLGDFTDYEKFNKFAKDFAEAVIKFEASTRKDTSVFDPLLKDSYGINPMLDFMLLQMERGLSRIPDKIKPQKLQKMIERPKRLQKLEENNRAIQSAIQEIYNEINGVLDRETKEIDKKEPTKKSLTEKINDVSYDEFIAKSNYELKNNKKNQQVKPQGVSNVADKQKDLTRKESSIEKTIYSATKEIISSLSRIEKAILAKYASPLADPWQNNIPDLWDKSNAESMRSFVDAINKVFSQ